MGNNPQHAAIYARISDDREGHALGVARQEADCRALADRLGWPVTSVFVDNDVSATSGRRRPEYERMLEAVRDGRISAVIVWDVDRLTRRPAELETFIDLAERHGVQLASVGGEIDLSTPQGQLTARIKGSVARHEAQQLQRRIRRKVEELASAGTIANGGPRPFGYTRIFAGEGPRRKILRDEINEEEAAIVRECAERYLAGDTLRAIVGNLNARGIATSTGGKWTMQAMRHLLRSGRIAGLREHRRVVVGPAVWPAIIEREQHEQLRAMLDSKHRPPGSRVRLHYLSGFVRCGTCGTAMRVKTHHGKLKYSCPPKQEGGCNGKVIVLADLEKLVKAYMVARLSDPDTLGELARREAVEDTRTQELLAQIDADERRLKMIEDALADDDEDTLPEVMAAARRVRTRLRACREQLAQLAGFPAALRESLPDLAERWDSLHLDRKQSLLRLFVERITIGPAVRGLGRFDPDRVDIVPRRPID